MNIGELTATLGIDASNFDRNIQRSTSSLNKFKGLIATLGIGALTYKLIQASKEWERLYKAQEQAEAGLRQAMISMKRYSDESYTGLLKLAKSIQATTTYGDEAVLSGLKMLQTYKDIGDDVMPRVARAMADLSALTGRDMVSSANLLGRASMGLTGELRRVGITVDEVVYKQQGFLGLLKQIEDQVGGQAAALARTKSGGLQQYYNTVGDLKEELGALSLEIKLSFLPLLKDITKQTSNWIEKQRELQRLGMDNFFTDIANSADRIANALDKITTGIEKAWPYLKKLPEILLAGIPGGEIISRSYLEFLKWLSSDTEARKRIVIEIYGPPKPEEMDWTAYEGFTGPDYWRFMAEQADKHMQMISDVTHRTFAEEMVESIQNWDTTFSSMLNDMVWGADMTFAKIAKSFGMMITEMMIREQIAKPFTSSLGGWIGGLFTGGGPGVATIAGETFGYMPGYAWAKGGVFENGLMKYAGGGIVDRPVIFPMQGGAGLMGEEGPEGVLPLKRMPGGDLGVQAQGGGGNYNFSININAVDAASFAELARRNPQAIIGPILEARDMGMKI